MRHFARFIDQHTALYYALCIAAGLTGRLYLAHWDLNLFFNPLFPILR